MKLRTLLAYSTAIAALLAVLYLYTGSSMAIALANVMWLCTN